LGSSSEVRLVKGDLHVTVREGTASLGRSARKNGDIAALVSYDDRLGVLTPNATMPYYIVFADLTRGPIAIEMPPNVRGGRNDAQRGLPGAGRAGKYLVLGSGQNAACDFTAP
jgi:hypothetical protein